MNALYERHRHQDGFTAYQYTDVSKHRLRWLVQNTADFVFKVLGSHYEVIFSDEILELTKLQTKWV